MSQNLAEHLQKEGHEDKIREISEENAASFFQEQEERILGSEAGKIAQKIKANDIEEAVKILEKSCG